MYKKVVVGKYAFSQKCLDFMNMKNVRLAVTVDVCNVDSHACPMTLHFISLQKLIGGSRVSLL